ncbi:MAG: hypothetical protein ACTILK_00570 [Bifidobacterium crudilactis]|uniref:hypothetical protein n=1 Tax=Bifidobacterium crudilactis TaxID=327277 RepID=UPI003F9898F9
MSTVTKIGIEVVPDMPEFFTLRFESGDVKGLMLLDSATLNRLASSLSDAMAQSARMRAGPKSR